MTRQVVLIVVLFVAVLFFAIAALRYQPPHFDFEAAGLTLMAIAALLVVS